MICEKCGKRQATVYIKTNVNGIYTEKHLCAECAKEYGGDFSDLSTAGFFSSMFAKPSEKATKRCKNCQTTEREFLKSGYLGCSECYETFSDSVNAVIRKVQGNTAHVGRTPTPVEAYQREEDRLSDELNKAIREEDFEKAVMLRDKIRALREKEGK